MTPTPTASLSLDLDNRWSYLKTRGDERWQELPSFLDMLVPRVTSFLGERGLKITFFVVGTDATVPGHGPVLRSLAAAGHEIGNHSHSHEPLLHRHSPSEIEEEICGAQAAIEIATGVKPRVFRGPGYSVSPDVIRVLAKHGYSCDASILPTWIGPLARAYYFRTARLTLDERKDRAQLFGRFRDGLLPLKPFEWSGVAGRVVEIPVTTLPGIRLPFHFSYLLYLSLYSRPLATAWFRSALALCRRTGTPPSLLLHPLDFLDAGDCPDLAFFPAMSISWERKRELLGSWLTMLSDRFDAVGVGEHARRAASGLPVRNVSLLER